MSWTICRFIVDTRSPKKILEIARVVVSKNVPFRRYKAHLHVCHICDSTFSDVSSVDNTDKPFIRLPIYLKLNIKSFWWLKSVHRKLYPDRNDKRRQNVEAAHFFSGCVIFDGPSMQPYMRSHCWKGTILRRAESVQNVIHPHKIQHISEWLLLH